MLEGAKTPTLYTIYGKQYDFNELQRSADQGLAEHLATLKRGNKDETQFREAYNNIMMGIKDGSITYQDGRFIDTKYGYHNSPDKDKNKDHYGLMANYIFNKMGKSSEYTKPEDKTKIKWNGSASVGQALIKELYNSDSENIKAFRDLDRDDLKNTKGRTDKLTSAFNKILSNFDNLFTGYTPADYQNYTGDTGYLNEALAALKDGTIDAGDYLALSRAASGLNYDSMFAQTQQKDYTEPQVAPDPETNKLELFRQFMDERHPQHTFVEKSPYDTTVASDYIYNQDIANLIDKSIKGASDNELYDIIKRIVRTPKEFNILGHTAFKRGFGDATLTDTNGNPVKLIQPVVLRQILKYLKDNNKLSGYSFGESDLGSFYIPDSWTNGGSSGLVWNSTTGKISEMDYLKIPYLRHKIIDEEFQKWLQQRQGNTGTSHWTDSYLYRQGGIIKANAGAVMNRTGIAQGVRGNSWLGVENTLANQADLNLWESYYKNDDIDKAISEGFKFYDNGYEQWNGNNTKYGLSAAQLGALFNRLDTIGSGLSWEKQLNKIGFDEWNRVFDQTGLNTFFGGESGKFKYLGPSTYNRHWLLERMKGKYNKENPLVIGEDKLYWDGNKWDLSLPEVKSQLPEIGPAEPPTPSLPTENNSTNIHLTTGDQKKPGGTSTGFLSTLEGLAPDLIGAGRLAISLNTNNRVAKTIRPTLTPVLKNTYERFSPITGDWYTRQSGYTRAGDIQSRFSRPITSDASLYTNTMLDANRQATALQSQADAADNQEIKRTAAEALSRVEDNMARRSEVANFNRASMNQTNREIAQLEASRLKSNWQSWDNYLQGIEGRLRTKAQEREQLRNAATRTALGTLYADAVAKLDASYKEAHPTATTSSMLQDQNYVNAVKDLQKQYQYNIYNSSFGNHEDPYKGYKPKSYEEILSGYTFSAKSGGRLSPSASYLVNKIIRNDSDS